MKTLAAAVLSALTLAAQQPAPNFQVSANGGREIELPQGWPLLVRGIIGHSQRLDPAASAPVRLAPPAMAWYDAIRFQVSSSTGEETSWNLKLAFVPEAPDLTLERNRYAVLEWSLSAETTKNFREGTYRLTATFDIKGGAGWNGSLRCVPVVIRVIPEPSPLSPEREVERARLRMQAALLEGRFEDAAAHIDALLEAQPASIYGLQAKARLLERRGQAPLALVPALQALAEFWKQNPNPPEPPAALLELVSRLREAAAAEQP